jgi:hypothetical protein
MNGSLSLRAIAYVRANWRSMLVVLLLMRILLSGAYNGAVNASSGVRAIDFSVYYDASCRLSKGGPLYVFDPHGYGYVYSPALALVMLPLTHLPVFSAFKVWSALSVGCLIASMIIFASLAGIRWRDLASVALMLIIGFRFWPTEMCVAFGQPNLIVLLLVSFMHLAARGNRMSMVGILIALATLIKTWMIGAIIFPIVRRSWTGVAVSLAVYAGMMSLLFSIVGWHEWTTFYRLTLNHITQGTGEHFPSLSVLGFARLHFATNGFVQPLINSPTVFYAFVILCTFLILAGLAYLWFHQTGQSCSLEDPLRLGLVILSLLLLSPLCETYYFVLCLPLFWTILVKPSGSPRQTLPCSVIVGTLFIYLLFTRGWPTWIPVPPSFQHGWRTLLVSAEFFWAFGLWLISFCAIVHLGKATPHNKLPGAAEGLTK